MAKKIFTEAEVNEKVHSIVLKMFDIESDEINDNINFETDLQFDWLHTIEFCFLVSEHFGLAADFAYNNKTRRITTKTIGELKARIKQELIEEHRLQQAQLDPLSRLAQIKRIFELYPKLLHVIKTSSPDNTSFCKNINATFKTNLNQADLAKCGEDYFALKKLICASYQNAAQGK